MDFITKASSLNLDTPIEEIKNNLVYGGNMKYKLFLLISIFLILLTSCEIKNPNMENTNEVVIIDFGEETRGMTYFPENTPFMNTKYGKEKGDNNLPYGFWLSSAVMRSLPVLPGIKTVNKTDFISAVCIQHDKRETKPRLRRDVTTIKERHISPIFQSDIEA